MGPYILRRVGLTAASLFIVTILVFSLLRMVPGGLASALLKEDVSPEAVLQLEEQLGLNDPVPVQYVRWLTQVVRLDFGDSLLDGRPISGLLADRAPVTMQLGLITLAFSVILGIPVGILSAIRPNSVGDYVLRTLAILGLAVPSFWLATMFLIYAANWLNYSPPLFYEPLWVNPRLNLEMMIWPSLIGSLLGAAIIMRMTRAMMLEVIKEDYIRTARSKGLPDRTVIMRHAMQNAMLPVITIFGLSVATILSGSVVIETVFSLPGMGRLLVNATLSRDLPVVQAIALVTGVVVMTVNLCVDLTYAVLDPRLR
jgi:peptide/nickel transport system permease protein